MDKEENRMGLKRKSKPMEALVDSDDDEPIGALLKLKGKGSSKKSKLVADGGGNTVKRVEKMTVEDEELGGMDDTLANFRKKLRGPKKDGGSAAGTGKYMISDVTEPLSHSLSESAKNREVDPHLMSEAHKRGLGSIEGESSGIATVVEGLKVKKMKKNRTKVNSNTNIMSNSELDDGLDYNISGNYAFKHKKEGASESEGEALEDSLSAFFQKVQSGMNWKSRSSSKLKQVMETHVSGDGLKLNPGTTLGAPFPKFESASEGSDCTLGKSANSSLKACSGKISGVEDSKLISIAIGGQPCSTNEPPDSNNIPDRNNEIVHCMEAKELELSASSSEGIAKINDDVKLDSRLNTDTGMECSGQLQQHSPPSAFNRPQQEHPFLDHDGASTVLDKCFPETDLAPASSQEADDQVSECRSSPVSGSGNLKYEIAFRKHKDESLKVAIESEHVLEPEDACPPSEDEEVNGTSSSSAMLDQHGSSAEDRGCLANPETKESTVSVSQRALRNAKKQKHWDMAYEGDIDWDVLMQGQEFFSSHQVLDRTRDKVNSLSTSVDPGNGKAAAVAAGLKARSVGPLEKIKFKEVLKRKGGLQEYLECRNHILGVWNKDVSRILPLADFGVSDGPLEGEGSRASLIRDIFNFLDQCGYINFGVPSKKEKVENCRNHHDLKLLTEEKRGEDSELPVADSDDGVSFILGKKKYSEIGVREKNDDTSAEGNMAGQALNEHGPIYCEAIEPYAPGVLEGCSPDDRLGSDTLDLIPVKDENGGDPAILQPSVDLAHGHEQYDSGQKNIVVVGAGPSGLAAARHLQRQGFTVQVLEARSRIGGRVFTDHSSLSVPVDLGASIITGVEADVATNRRPDPSALICAQLGLELTVLNSDCPLYDTVTCQKVPADLDEELEAEFNSLLDEMVLVVAEKGERAMRMSLEEGLEYGLKRRRIAHYGQDDMDIPVKSQNACLAAEEYSADDVQEFRSEGLSPLERRVMDWHFAHLEYGCAALLKEVSLPNWNQDDAYGGFGGPHCMIKGGYSAVIESLGEGICVHLDHVVTDISYRTKDSEATNKKHKKVKVSTSNGKEFSADAVLVTVPLGCLKAETIRFSPPLPQWKYLAIKNLGFGVLNKVVLEFPEVFWDDTIDYFGATAENKDQRGWCFMFWNVKKTVGAPILIALLVGKAAIDGQNIDPSDHVSHALLVLRKLFGEEKVSDPIASVVTNWGMDPYSYGAYSYVAIGSSGEDYDILGRPVENCLFFAGEATCKEHPDTVGGAMMSGLREAVRIIDILNTGTDYMAEVEAMEAARRHLDVERSEVKDIIRRLDALEFSSSFPKKSLDGSQISTWGLMLKDMFFTAKTTAGRLHLAKELLNLPVGFLKTFASTKEGLSTLNSWILDSMGKDGTQLLRHCVRLLVRVSNNLVAVRLSGIGKTVREKVCVHTSRDIRAIASQLVSVWVELFRKEKASKGGRKILRQSSSLDSKSKSALVTGKPPLRTHHVESKESSKFSASARHQFPASASTKKWVGEPVKSEANTQPINSHGSCGNVMEEDSHEIPMSQEEKAAFAAAEEARAAAIAAAKAYAASRSALVQAPKILSFHKFAMREQSAHMDESDSRKNWPGAATGRQDCLSEIDSRNCRVRDWSVDFSATGVNLEGSKMAVDNHSHRGHPSEIGNQLNIREHSGESVAVDSSFLTKAWVDGAGSIGIKDYNAIERWQSQAAAASSGFSHGTMHITDEEGSSMSSKLHKQRRYPPPNDSSASQVTINKESKSNQPRGAEQIKMSVRDYVTSLLMPLYSAKKIDKDSYKSILKKTIIKVMEHATDAEKAMSVSDFLDSKRKNKVRTFVDMLIERRIAMKPDVKSGSSEKS